MAILRNDNVKKTPKNPPGDSIWATPEVNLKNSLHGKALFTFIKG
jgi:hypothetical protein